METTNNEAGLPEEALTALVPGALIRPSELSPEERKSFTHGNFDIPANEEPIFADALRSLNEAGVPYVVSGLYAMHHYTGIYRETKDLDLLFEPRQVVSAARVLRAAGFETRLESAHWLAKATWGAVLVDLVYGMANGLHLIDAAWYRHSRAGLLAGIPVRVAPPEELIFHRLFIAERHRTDLADVVHLIMIRGSELDWPRLLERVGDHWRLLLAQIHLFDFAYPGRRREIPAWVRDTLNHRALVASNAAPEPPGVCQGTLISRFSFAIDVNEWGFTDYREEAIRAARSLPIIEEIRNANVWDSVSEDPLGWEEAEECSHGVPRHHRHVAAGSATETDSTGAAG